MLASRFYGKIVFVLFGAFAYAFVVVTMTNFALSLPFLFLTILLANVLCMSVGGDSSEKTHMDEKADISLYMLTLVTEITVCIQIYAACNVLFR